MRFGRAVGPLWAHSRYGSGISAVLLILIYRIGEGIIEALRGK